jgi:hypothetical protein
VRAASGSGLAPTDLPPVDMDLLVRAFDHVRPGAGAASCHRAHAAGAYPNLRRCSRTIPAGGCKHGAHLGRTGRRGDPAPGTGTRAYRRMPDSEQVIDIYQQTGTIAGVAEHFGVPRHTVAGWARRLRAQGHAIGRQ